jgi:hypothetical protein
MKTGFGAVTAPPSAFVVGWRSFFGRRSFLGRRSLVGRRHLGGRRVGEDLLGEIEVGDVRPARNRRLVGGSRGRRVLGARGLRLLLQLIRDQVTEGGVAGFGALDRE